MTLKDRTAVVTGGGRGIGAAIAKTLAEAGAKVVVAARTPEEIDRVAASLRQAGHHASALPCDVTRPESVQDLARQSRRLLGPIDILINNAGVASSAPLRSTSLEEWNRLMTVNATGTFLCTQAFLPSMIERRWGRVVNLASVAARAGAAYISAYAAAKHAVLGFTRSMAAEVALHGVTINALCPGYVETDLTQETLDRIVEKTGISPDQARKKIETFSAQKRIFSPEEVAFAVLFLCDDRTRGINGQAIVIDGGTLLA